MRRMLHRLISLLLCLALLLSMLPATAEEVTVTPYASAAFRDPYTAELLNKGAGSKAVCGQHTYIFPGLVSEEMARAYVAQAEAVFDLLTARGVPDRAMKVHLVAGSHPLRVDGSTLYLPLSAFRSMDYVTGLAQLCLGQETVYGLVYAVSCEVAAALGMSVEEVPAIADALPCFRGEEIIYTDMNYACFIAPYTDAAMQANVKALARDFYASLSPEEQEALLTGYTNQAFYTRLNQYLVANRLPIRQNSWLWHISFYSGGPSIAVCWETPLATFAVANGYNDIYGADWYGTDGAPLMSTYADLLMWVGNLCDMLSHLQARFSAHITFRKPLIVFDHTQTGVMAGYHDYYTNGYYLSNTHTIYTGAIEVTDHEYVHALIVHEGVNMDMNEVLAYSYTIALMPENLSYEWYDIAYAYEMRSYATSSTYDPEWSTLTALARSTLGHWMQYYERDDLLVLMDIVTLHRGYANHASLQAAYSTTADLKAAKISYWRYLMRTYGEDTALAAALADDPVTHLGKSWEALENEWIVWLESTYPLTTK